MRRFLSLGAAVLCIALASGCGLFTVSSPSTPPEPPPTTTSPTPPRHNIVVQVTGTGTAGVSYVVDAYHRQTYDPKAHGKKAKRAHKTAKADKLPWRRRITIFGTLATMPTVTARALGHHKHRKLTCKIVIDGHTLITQHSTKGKVSCKPGDGASLT